MNKNFQLFAFSSILCAILVFISACQSKPQPTSPPTIGWTPTSPTTTEVPPQPECQIAFASDRDGNSEIYVVNAEGGGLQNVSNHYAYDSEPAWSPDGSKIAFVSDREGNEDIFIIAPCV